jgi:hypothetical protein
MEITQEILGFTFIGVAVATLVIIVVGANWTDWTKKKDHHDSKTEN